MLNLNKLITRTGCQECCSDVQAINFKFFKPFRDIVISKNFTGEIFLHWCTGGALVVWLNPQIPNPNCEGAVPLFSHSRRHTHAY